MLLENLPTTYSSPQEHIDNPAAMIMWSLLKAVLKHHLIRAAGLLQSSGKVRQAVEGALTVNTAGNLSDSAVVPCEPFGIEFHRAEWVTVYTSH
jgi:hypothetical protein